MDFNFILTLEEQALLKVADTLWTGDCVNKVVVKYFERGLRNILSMMWLEELGELMDEMVNNMFLPRISSIVIPETIKRKLLCITRRVGMQKVEWYFYHRKLWRIEKLPNRFYWTAQGCVARQKTAEVLVTDDTIVKYRRFSLACFYCIENQIRTMYKDDCRYLLAPPTHEEGLRDFWTSIIRLEQQNVSDFPEIDLSYEDYSLRRNKKCMKMYADAYIDAMEDANNVAAEYLLKKISRTRYNLQRRKEDRMYFFYCMLEDYGDYYQFPPTQRDIDFTFYLLKRMTKTQQKIAFRSNLTMKIMLKICLRWPFHSLFFQVTKTFRRYISKNVATHILNKILKKEIEIFEDFNYCDLCTEVWQMLPQARKAGFINRLRRSTWLLSSLLESENSKCLFMVLGDATDSQKEELIFSAAGRKICEIFALNGEMNLLKLFFDCCLPSRSRASIIKFKKRLKFLPKDTISDILSALEIKDIRN